VPKRRRPVSGEAWRSSVRARRTRVAFPAGLPAALTHADPLIEELVNFQARVRLTRDPSEAWREGQHEDLELAAALAGWWAERGGCGPRVVKPDTRSRGVLCDVSEGVFRS
jgi:hypothetical protein